MDSYEVLSDFIEAHPLGDDKPIRAAGAPPLTRLVLAAALLVAGVSDSGHARAYGRPEIRALVREVWREAYAVANLEDRIFGRAFLRQLAWKEIRALEAPQPKLYNPKAAIGAATALGFRL